MAPDTEGLKSHFELYQRWGFSIIPIGYKSKRPLIKWEQYQNNRPNQDDLIGWWDNYWSNGNQNNIDLPPSDETRYNLVKKGDKWPRKGIHRNRSSTSSVKQR